MSRLRGWPAAALLSVAWLFSQLAAAPAHAADLPPRPPPRFETVPASPGPSYAWQPGRWRWTGARYTWARGRYRQTAPGPFRYERGHSDGAGPLRVYVPGHFAAPASDQSRGDRPADPAHDSSVPAKP
jgi:hypothetical protein